VTDDVAACACAVCALAERTDAVCAVLERTATVELAEFIRRDGWLERAEQGERTYLLALRLVGVVWRKREFERSD
jgi:hypothetical protein